ncbi:MAG: hydrogenase maturation nickel metallochaperone HypA [Azonexus sp.]|nr:hydrogenase maturation nickel metallochaperone HypA [Azonexus sp.]
MHELSLCMNLVDQLTDLARHHGARSVARIELQIGTLSGIEAKLLENAFPFASAGSVAEAAVLHTEIVPPRIKCRNCDQQAEAAPNRLVCDSCGSFDTELLSGQDLILSRVELVRDDPVPSLNSSTKEKNVH